MADGEENALRQGVGYARRAALGTALFFAFSQLPAEAQQAAPDAPLVSAQKMLPALRLRSASLP